MYDELIERLRERAIAFDYDGWVEAASDYEKAADAIEELSKSKRKPQMRKIVMISIRRSRHKQWLDLTQVWTSISPKGFYCAYIKE